MHGLASRTSEGRKGAPFLRPFGKAVVASHIKWLVADDTKHWRTQPFTWISPAHCAVLSNKNHTGGMWAKLVDEERPMLQTAAKQAFWDCSLAQFITICKHLGVAVAGDDTLFQRLQKLIRHCLPAVSMEELHDILAKLINSPVPLQEFVES